jgi:chaperonin cofactor prefoldin
MFQEKGGVSKETEERLDNLKKKSDLYEMSVSLIEEQKKALATNFQDRRGLMEGRK